MSFLYPLGFLGLIGIPVLIIIYIIKNKYTEQVIASTYLWTLSERFLKKRLPINKLVGIISLILQILAVLFLSVALAHPVFGIPGAANDYCFILDGSGSMTTEQNGASRFALAKDEIQKMIEESERGSAYTLVFVGGTADLIYEGVTDKEHAISMLGDVSQVYVSDAYEDALGKAQEVFDGNASTLTYFFTDKEVAEKANVTVVNVSDRRQNYAVSNAGYEFDKDGKKLRITGSVISYESDSDLAVKLYLNGSEEAAEKQDIKVVKGEEEPFTFERQTEYFQSARIVIENDDALPLDNEVILYSVDNGEPPRALIVSDVPLYIRNAFNSVEKVETTVVTKAAYHANPNKYTVDEQYDLYVFDSYQPQQLPDAAVWFFNLGNTVTGSGFTVNDQSDPFEKGVVLDYCRTPETTLRETLFEGVKFEEIDDIYIRQYWECSFRGGFTTLLWHNNNSLVLAGSTDTGNREVVFAFDLQDTDMPLHMNFDVLVKNLIEYSLPTVIESTFGYCGETLQINAITGCESIRVTSPVTGKISYLNTSNSVCELELTEVGTYSIVLMMTDKTTRTFNFYSALPESERKPLQESAVAFRIEGEPSAERRDGIYDDLLAFFLVLAVMFLADWGVYCYEQYQLR